MVTVEGGSNDADTRHRHRIDSHGLRCFVLKIIPDRFKFVAALQRAQAGTAPVLLRVATRGGHGGGKAISRRIEEVADQFVFLRKMLEIR